MEIRNLAFHSGLAPHLKGEAAHESEEARSIAAAGIFFIAVCFAGGAAAVASAAVLFMAWLAGDRVGHWLSPAPAARSGLDFLPSLLFLFIFFPSGLPLAWIASAGGATAFFYRLSGGRAGCFLQPVCLGLGILFLAGREPDFMLAHLLPSVQIALGLIWLASHLILRKKNGFQKIFFAGLLTLLLMIFEFRPLFSGFLLSAILSEILFDSILAPLSVRGRNFYYALTFILFAVLLPGWGWSTALIWTGLAAGFFAAPIEEDHLPKRVYA